MNDLVSVVVPVYNVEKYIAVCANSLINQTYKNIEIIFVDDGSTDASGKICDDFAREYDFVRIVHKENGGLSEARNEGMRVSRGKYIVFVDSDDYVSLDFIAVLAKKFESDIDISCCAYVRFDDGSAPQKMDISDEYQIFTGNEAMKFCYSKQGRYIDVVAWNKMYRKSLFAENNIAYPKGKYFEDLYTTFRLFYHARNVCINTSALYYYRQRSGSIMATSMTMAKYENLLDALKYPLRFYENHCHAELYTLAFSMYCRIVIKHFYNTKRIKDKIEREERQEILLNDYTIIYARHNADAKLSLLRKIVFRLFLIFPHIISGILR